MPSSAALRKIASFKWNDIRERRMAAHDFSVLRRDQPIDPRCRVTCAQLHKHGQRMDDVAQARKFDQQNAREFYGLQSRDVSGFCGCLFGLTVQWAKVNRT